MTASGRRSGESARHAYFPRRSGGLRAFGPAPYGHTRRDGIPETHDAFLRPSADPAWLCHRAEGTMTREGSGV